MALTKKHLEAFAAALKEVFPGAELEQDVWRDCVNQITDVCARFNHGFDRTRFLKACGVEENSESKEIA